MTFELLNLTCLIINKCTEPGHVAFKEEETPELLFPAVIDKGADERPKDNVEEPPPHEYEKKEQTPTRIFDTGTALVICCA
jgi:hypothetical protein